MSDTIWFRHPRARSAPRGRAESGPASVRLTARGRFLVVVVMAVVAMAVVGLVIGRPSGAAGDQPRPAAQRTVVVQPGQTLWSIAKEVAPTQDVRGTVYQIRKLNGLSDAMVTSGQVLVLPEP